MSELSIEDKAIKHLHERGFKVGYKEPYQITEDGLIHFMVDFAKEYQVNNIIELLVAWEQFKKSHRWESSVVDVERILMETFQVSYGVHIGTGLPTKYIKNEG